jgi:hypothetical protein
LCGSEASEDIYCEKNCKYKKGLGNVHPASVAIAYAASDISVLPE